MLLRGTVGELRARSCLVITLPVDPSAKGVWVVQLHIYHVGCAQRGCNDCEQQESGSGQIREAT